MESLQFIKVTYQIFKYKLLSSACHGIILTFLAPKIFSSWFSASTWLRYIHHYICSGNQVPNFNRADSSSAPDNQGRDRPSESESGI